MKGIILNFICSFICFAFLIAHVVQGNVPEAILSGVSTILCFLSALGIYLIHELSEKSNHNE